MQHPVGYALRNGRAELTDFAAVVFNPFSILQILHVVPAALLLAAFFVMGISAYHLLRKQDLDFFTRSFRIGLAVGAVTAIWVVIGGDMHAKHVT
jgi:cytochrome d ubiquinol oxidase subunit I